MVCIYCGKDTHVINSRLQKRTNSVWRRRHCPYCGAVFTSLEHTAYERSIGVSITTSHIVPFDRDLLFLSLYEACRHRPKAVSDAAALTDTVIRKLIPRHIIDGTLKVDDIVRVTTGILRRFDKAAYVHYQAFHPLVGSTTRS